MSRHRWALAIAAVLAIAIAPAWGQNASTTYNKDAVKALSKRIDEHLARTWKQAGVIPAPKAEDHVFFRRLQPRSSRFRTEKLKPWRRL